MNKGIDVPGFWQELVEKIYNDRGVVIVLGGSDTGKTTLINYLFTELNNNVCKQKRHPRRDCTNNCNGKTMRQDSECIRHAFQSG